jgi:hypothetical protein
MTGTGDPGGVGYETGSGYEGYITIDVRTEMYNQNDTCYIRIPFTIDSDPCDFTDMTLRVRYDDGYVAYINGTEVARRNFTGTPDWDSSASDTHSDGLAVLFEDVDVRAYIGELRSGKNLLAIHGLNNSGNRPDFLISAELVATATTAVDDYIDKGLALLDGLRVTEIMYHDPSGSDYDYIELQNTSDSTLDLTGVRFLDGIIFTFPAITLGPSQYVVVYSNQSTFEARYGTGINAVGPYTGNLSNGGEDILLTLAWPLEAAIMRFDYDDAWYPLTDGGGQSLVILDPNAHPATWDEAESWQAAAPSPGTQ